MYRYLRTQSNRYSLRGYTVQSRLAVSGFASISQGRQHLRQYFLHSRFVDALDVHIKARSAFDFQPIGFANSQRQDIVFIPLVIGFDDS